MGHQIPMQGCNAKTFFFFPFIFSSLAIRGHSPRKCEQNWRQKNVGLPSLPFISGRRPARVAVHLPQGPKVFPELQDVALYLCTKGTDVVGRTSPVLGTHSCQVQTVQSGGSSLQTRNTGNRWWASAMNLPKLLPPSPNNILPLQWCSFVLQSLLPRVLFSFVPCQAYQPYS